MKRTTVMAFALCLMMIALVSGAAPGGVAGLPGYDDALAAASNRTAGISSSGSISDLPGYQNALNSSREYGSFGSKQGYQDALNARGILGTTPSGALLDQWKGMPGDGAGWEYHQPISALDLLNLGWFVAQMACYYSTDGGVTWHESEHVTGITNSHSGFAELDDLGVPKGALVKMHAVIVGGKDKTGSEVFQYVHYHGYDTGSYAEYWIPGTTWNPTLHYDGLTRWGTPERRLCPAQVAQDGKKKFLFWCGRSGMVRKQ